MNIFNFLETLGILISIFPFHFKLVEFLIMLSLGFCGHVEDT